MQSLNNLQRKSPYKKKERKEQKHIQEAIKNNLQTEEYDAQRKVCDKEDILRCVKQFKISEI